MLLRTVLRAASAWLIWRWLAPRWRGTLALAIGWLMIAVLHAEYIEYVQISERTELLWLSYIIKWLLIAVGIGAWVWWVVLAPASPTPHAPPHEGGSQTPATDVVDDGFDFLRQKRQLDSRGDQLLHDKISRSGP